MLDLYHWEPNGASARALICLEEKGLAFSSRFVDLLALEQYQPPLRSIEPSGAIPVLVRDDAAYTGASAIGELLEEAFPEPALMPRDARGRWKVRVWQKYVDDSLAASVTELAWHVYGAGIRSRRHDELAGAVERLVPEEKRPLWRDALAGYDDEQLARARGRIAGAVAQMEEALADSTWIAGAEYTLADIAVFAYFNYLPALCTDIARPSSAPRAMRWLERMASRPAVQAALARGRAADPFAVAAPAPEQIRWG